MPEYRIAQRICRLRMERKGDGELDEVEKIVGEWNELYPGDRVGEVARDGVVEEDGDGGKYGRRNVVC
jgi:hypothetical protein